MFHINVNFIYVVFVPTVRNALLSKKVNHFLDFQMVPQINFIDQ